jgi:hypothetical protein
VNFKKGELIEGDIVDVNGEEYKFVTIRNRSKLVSKDGKLLNPYRNQEVGLHTNPDGYLCSGGGVPVHLYVAHAWVDGYDETKEVNHKDFDRKNNNYKNLEWVTHLENIQRSVDGNYEVICKSKRGTNNGRATFTEEQVLKIRKLYDTGKYSIADLVRMDYPELKSQKDYHSIWSTYSNIVKRITWKYI